MSLLEAILFALFYAVITLLVYVVFLVVGGRVLEWLGPSVFATATALVVFVLICTGGKL